MNHSRPKPDYGRAPSGILASLAVLAGIALLITLTAVVVYHRIRPPVAAVDDPPVKLVAGSREMLEVSDNVRNSLGLVTAPVKSAGIRDHLELLGSLFIDPGQMVRVRARFPGEVVTIGDAVLPEGFKGLSGPRPLHIGDRVSKGQLLAVVWSKDLGEKKSDLVDALSQLGQHERQYQKLKSLDRGFVSEKDIRDAQRQREADQIQVETVESTLLAYRLTKEEINVARVEAEKIHKGEPSDIEAEQHWAEVEVRAPRDGILLERNATVGDQVTTDADLFKIADLSRLGVLVHTFEADVPELQALGPEARQWTVYLKSQTGDRGTPGSFDAIGKVVDPTQHTTTVTGWVDNRQDRLRVGQFVTAVVDLPAPKGDVVMPKSALVEQGDHAVVFVAANGEARRVERRQVCVTRRAREQVFVRSEPPFGGRCAGCKSLKPGELVITSGAVELAGALQDVLSALPPDAAPATSSP